LQTGRVTPAPPHAQAPAPLQDGGGGALGSEAAACDNGAAVRLCAADR